MPSKFVSFIGLLSVVALCCSAAAAADTPRQPFNGKDLSGWKTKGGEPAETLIVGTAEIDSKDVTQLTVVPGGSDLINAHAHARDFYTEEQFGDGVYEMEFMVPQRSNSGIYLMGEYEIQILDSYGREKIGPGDVGGIYGVQRRASTRRKRPANGSK